MYLGVDGCPDGWIAVQYDESGYVGATLYDTIDALWDDRGDAAAHVLIDVPIGLREDSSAQRPCDSAARERLSPRRHASVFSVPIRAAVHADSYESAKEIQEARTDGSLGVQSWAIADKIAELDGFLRTRTPEARGVVREAHPEVCFWACNDEEATEYSKTGQPAAAFWERIDILERLDPDLLECVRAAGTGIGGTVANDDLLDAFILALTASPFTGPLRTLPREADGDQRDPTGLPMEMVYASPG